MSKFHFSRVFFVFAPVSIAFTNAAYAQTAAAGATVQPGGGSPTRGSEKADLKNLEAHGYRPVANESNYPNSVIDACVFAPGNSPPRKQIGRERKLRPPAVGWAAPCCLH
jgi:hypothetical protein